MWTDNASSSIKAANVLALLGRMSLIYGESINRSNVFLLIYSFLFTSKVVTDGYCSKRRVCGVQCHNKPLNCVRGKRSGGLGTEMGL